MRQWIPVVASASLFAVAQQIALLFASGLEDGSTSALSNALVFWQLPFGILSASVVTAHFPRMSRNAAARDQPALAATFAGGLKLIIALLLPPTLFYLFLGQPVIQVALERMTFSALGTTLASRVLAGYTIGLVSVGIFTFVQRFFFATQDYRTPFLVALAVVAVDIPLSLVLKETALRWPDCRSRIRLPSPWALSCCWRSRGAGSPAGAAHLAASERSLIWCGWLA